MVKGQLEHEVQWQVTVTDILKHNHTFITCYRTTVVPSQSMELEGVLSFEIYKQKT